MIEDTSKILPSGDRARKAELKEISREIATATQGAKYGGIGNTRLENIIDSLLEQGKITREEATDLVTSIYDDVKEK